MAFVPYRPEPKKFKAAGPSPNRTLQVTGGLSRLFKRIAEQRIPIGHRRDAFTNEEGFLILSPDLPDLHGRYRARSIIGEGTFAQLFYADDMFARGRRVAIKVMNSKYEFIGKQESEKLAFLNFHDRFSQAHIVRFFGAFYFDDHFCMVLEVLGSCLLTHVRNRLSLPVDELREIAIQLLAAFGFLKKLGVIHADLKPENVLLEGEREKRRRVKLIDFGNAINGKDSASYWAEMEVQTLYYRAPEVLLGLPIGCPIDMWSLGCLLVELSTGQPLFTCKTPKDLFREMCKLLGPFPAHLFATGHFAARFFNGTGDLDFSTRDFVSDVNSTYESLSNTSLRNNNINNGINNNRNNMNNNNMYNNNINNNNNDIYQRHTTTTHNENSYNSSSSNSNSRHFAHHRHHHHHLLHTSEEIGHSVLHNNDSESSNFVGYSHTFRQSCKNLRWTIHAQRRYNLSKLLRCKDINFISFLLGLLEYDPRMRLTPEQAIRHPFFHSFFPFSFFLDNSSSSSTSSASSTVFNTSPSSSSSSLPPAATAVHRSARHSPLSYPRSASRLPSPRSYYSPTCVPSSCSSAAQFMYENGHTVSYSPSLREQNHQDHRRPFSPSPSSQEFRNYSSNNSYDARRVHFAFSTSPHVSVVGGPSSYGEMSAFSHSSSQHLHPSNGCVGYFSSSSSYACPTSSGRRSSLSHVSGVSSTCSVRSSCSSSGYTPSPVVHAPVSPSRSGKRARSSSRY